MTLIFENNQNVKETQSRVVLKKNEFVQKGVQTTINACVDDCPVKNDVLCNFFQNFKKVSKNKGLKEKKIAQNCTKKLHTIIFSLCNFWKNFEKNQKHFE